MIDQQLVLLLHQSGAMRKACMLHHSIDAIIGRRIVLGQQPRAVSRSRGSHHDT